VRGNYKILQHSKKRTLGRKALLEQHCKGFHPFHRTTTSTASHENEKEKQITMKGRVNPNTSIDTDLCEKLQAWPDRGLPLLRLQEMSSSSSSCSADEEFNARR